MPRTAVIIPTFNEEAHIGGLLDQLVQQPEAVIAEIIVADGRSIDATRAIVGERSMRDPRIRLVDNPQRLQASGVNLAVKALPFAIVRIVRIDAHSRYPEDYVPRLIDAMDRNEADSVVVRLDSIGGGATQRAIAAVSNSRIGTGGSAHRVGGYSGFVDHGHHAAFRRSVFEAAGGYDPNFEANEDAELDVRIRRMGGRIWLAGDIEVGYFPRTTLTGLARQYFRYGSGRARTWLKHREALRLRQMAAPALVVTMALALILALFTPWALLIPAAYLAILTVYGTALAIRRRSACLLLAAPALTVMHIAWGAGFIHRLLLGRPKAKVRYGAAVQ
ncbi:succinoglycan biosynthesis protein exoa [Sphingomonas sp. DBB INV C78]|uniref:glycosyltransferase family 2 protein n=1 Tax=Sphingomonas sp. DBB INV C78 TaxID=3349434 RepID=UPI0036D3FA26